MLQKFLWLFSLEFGAYLVGWSCVCGFAVSNVNILKFAAMNQGNSTFVVVLFLSTLLLLSGVYQVRFETFHHDWQKTADLYWLQKNLKIMLPSLFLQAAGTADGLVFNLMELNQPYFVVLTPVIEKYTAGFAPCHCTIKSSVIEIWFILIWTSNKN